MQQEFAYLEHYLALQQLRVSHKTSLTLSFPPDAGHYQLPPLLLIMLVENAYKHGVDNSLTQGWVRISADIRGQRLYFRCENSHPAASSGHSRGMGLQNLRRRLQLYYGDDFVLHSQPQSDGWYAELQITMDYAEDLASSPTTQSAFNDAQEPHL